MNGRDVIVIGASTGGFEALRTLLSTLPADIPASIFGVLHIPMQPDELLPDTVGTKTSLPVHTAIDGEEFRHGHVYLAPPNNHLLIDGTHLRRDHGPRENRHRPAIDPLFRSAAKSWGPRVTGVLLSGHLDDGVIGLNTIKTHGGIAIVQSPEETVASEMVRTALRDVQVDYTLPVLGIGKQLVALATTEIAPPAAARPPDGTEADPPTGLEKMRKTLGSPTAYACPECHGPLWERKVGQASEFRCHVGHSYSLESLLIDQDRDLESALWSAVRGFEQQADLLHRLVKRDVKGPLLKKWAAEIEKHEKNANAIRTLLQARR